jgi:hypothetical protein
MTQAEVKSWIAFMREHGVRRLSVGGLELELGGSPQSQSTTVEPMAQQGAFEDSTGSVCACGHAWVTDHSDAGCLHGCSHDLCSSTGGASNVGS